MLVAMMYVVGLSKGCYAAAGSGDTGRRQYTWDLWGACGSSLLALLLLSGRLSVRLSLLGFVIVL